MTGSEPGPVGRLPDLSQPTLEGLGIGACPDVPGYEILRVLGEGGMGVVYLARQTSPLEREVALKVVKPGMDSRQVVARFETERQALALLDHPNIAHIYEAGTTRDARPYFVMEYVDGPSLTEFCDQHKLNLEERLVLFAQVCEGVHHAHTRGILHRDLKPSNILICLEGGRPIPKIIDFGVAKALIAPLIDRTLVTEQDQLLGTPEYMSPEQGEMRKGDIDVRSDVYSLGAVLYELLTGVPPFDGQTLRAGGIDHIRRTLREEDPSPPGTRLSSVDADEVRKIAAQRRTEVSALTRQLRKELEWIPLKAMRKERAQRYPSALALAEDIRNYLAGARLAAGPASIMYRLRKFGKRRWVAVLGASAVAAAALIGITVGLALNARTVTPLRAPVLGVATHSRAGTIILDLPNLPQDIPDAAPGRLVWCLGVTSAPKGAIVTGVSYQFTIDNRGDASNFWCSDYEMGISSDARGAIGNCYCWWSHQGGKTDGNRDDDEPDDSDLEFSRSTPEFNGQNPNQDWQFTVVDTVHEHDGPVPLPGEGRVTRGRIMIHYAIAVDLAAWEPPSWSFSPASLVEGQPDQHFEVSCCIANFGVNNTGPLVVAFYASSDTAITLADYLIGVLPLGEGFPGNSGSTPCVWSGNFPTNIPAGRYYVGCIIDTENVVPESDETNNTSYMTTRRLSVLKPID
jgi:serine/threonine protein kinase